MKNRIGRLAWKHAGSARNINSQRAPGAAASTAPWRPRIRARILGVTAAAALLSAGTALASVSGGHYYNNDGSPTTCPTTSGSPTGNYYGDCQDSGDVGGEDVKVDNENLDGVVGAATVDGDSTGNTVHIRNGSDVDSVFGGNVGDGNGNATGNTVTVDDSTVQYNVYGGGVFGDGTASGNTVTVNNSIVDEEVNGGGVSDGDATGNTVTINGSTVGTDSFFDNVSGGVVGDDGNATDNTVTVDDSTVKGLVFGGWVGGDGGGHGTASDNTVTINNSTVDWEVYGGGMFGDGDATGNTVTVKNNSGADEIYGGFVSLGGNATGNTVNVKNDSGANEIYGGSVGYGNATDNTVTIKNNSGAGGIFGGYVDSDGDAAGNTVTVDDSGGGYIAGGYVEDDGGATDNTVHIRNGSDVDYVSGGEVGDGNAIDNTVTVDDSTVHDVLYGGAVYGDGGATGNAVTVNDSVVDDVLVGGAVEGNGDASGNSVTINDSMVNGKVFGGAVSNGTATGNTVAIDDSKVNSVFGGGVDGVSGNATGNAVTITSGAIVGAVDGGLLHADGDVTDNTVTVDGSTVHVVTGGTVDLTFDGNATGNTVTITSGATVDGVFGGFVHGDGTVSGNTVIVDDSTVNGAVIGGAVNGNGAAKNNRIILRGQQLDLTGAELIGGEAPNGTVSGNVLEVHSTGIKAKQAKGFDRYEFYLPAGTAGGDTVLTLTDGTQTDLSNAEVGVAGTNVDLSTGDRLTLVSNSNGGVDTTGVQQADIGPLASGAALQYDYALDSDANSLYIEVGDASLQAQTKAPLEGRVGGMAFVNQGADIAAGSGMQAALKPGGTPLFLVLSGGHSHYDTGSHTDVDGVNFMLGAALHFDSLTVAPFIEAGDGSYDTYNSFPGQRVRGQGDTHYVGAGVMLHQQWQSGLYAEGTLRGGHLSYDWHSYDMRGIDEASYDGSAGYFGLNVGAGYKLAFSDSTGVDVSAKYFWTHLRSDAVTIAGDRYHFDSVDSQRTRLGARVTHAYNDSISVYTDLAWLHEFDGKARATVYGMSTPAPELKGDTGALGIGASYTPAGDSSVTLGVGVAGYVGARKGVSGQLNLGWTF